MLDQLTQVCRTKLTIMGSTMVDFFKKNKAPFFFLT